MATSSLSYDEATYVELASHPWRSGFYPDAIFVRHPPLYFLLMWAWTAVAGTSEVAVRLPSLAASLGGVVLTWAALRRLGGDRAAALGAILLGTSFLTLTYGLQATMYPLGFGLAALGLWAHAERRERTEKAALGLLCLTHLFGFVFAGVWLWRRRIRTRRDYLPFAPAALWLALAAISVILVGNPAGPALGPAWQMLRVFALLYEAFVEEGALFIHVAVFALALLLLNPAVLRAAWKARRRWSPWAAAGILLTIGLLPGPGFLRYALLLVPAVLAAGLPDLARSTRYPRVATAVIASALLATTASAAYVMSGLDPRVGNDVPGHIEWTETADRVADAAPGVVYAPAPTALAYYLQQRHGWVVSDNVDGPSRLELQGASNESLVILELARPSQLAATSAGALVVLPLAWVDEADLAGFAACGDVEGARILRHANVC